MPIRMGAESPGPSGPLKRTGGLPRESRRTPAQPPERGKAVPPAKESSVLTRPA
jgi:hypothetical protein